MDLAIILQASGCNIADHYFIGKNQTCCRIGDQPYVFNARWICDPPKMGEPDAAATGGLP